jgi:predicted nucleic acid-binding protein
LLARLSDPDDAYLVVAREYQADYLVSGDNGLLGTSNLVASSALDLPGVAVLAPRDFIQQIEPQEERRTHSRAGAIHPTSE